MKASGCEVELSSSPLHRPVAFVSHANAVLTPITRLRLTRLVVEDGWTYAAAAKMFMVCQRTAGSGPTGTAPRRHGNSGSKLTAALQPGQDLIWAGPTDRAAAVAAPARAGPDRRPTRDARLNRACCADALQDQPLVAA